MKPRDVLHAEEQYTLCLRIGLPDREWGSADRAFPDEALSRDERGHSLKVFFSEPEVVPTPMASTIHLPLRGNSTTCEFMFRIGAETRSFLGRVIVVHENRVLQTALLEARVAAPGAAPAAGRKSGGVRFTIESVVRPAMDDLDSRSRFSAAIVTNQNRKSGAQATCISGDACTLVNLEDVEGAITEIESIINDCPWEDIEKKGLDSPQVLDLLRSLALHGRFLHDALVTDRAMPRSLAEADRIQVVAASAEARHLPVEFCYVREPPGEDARLCPKLQAALSEGSTEEFPWKDCSLACIPPEQEASVVCPWAFWSLNRIIEWHRFDPSKSQAMGDAEYALQSERTVRQPRLAPLRRILLAASSKVKPAVKKVGSSLAEISGAQPVIAMTWKEWTARIGDLHPTLLVLLVHTQMVRRALSMEIGGALLDPPYVRASMVMDPGQGDPPVVLLLGCGTGIARVGFHMLPVQFRRKGAAVVVSTVAELLDVHAPRLADLIVRELGRTSGAGRPFGEVMLTVKRTALLGGLPVAMALIASGDADWEV